jgi:hypothetical protein
MGMAIMWDLTEQTPSLEESPAEIAWRLWLLETLAHAQTDEAGHLRLLAEQAGLTPSLARADAR